MNRNQYKQAMCTTQSSQTLTTCQIQLSMFFQFKSIGRGRLYVLTRKRADGIDFEVQTRLIRIQLWIRSQQIFLLRKTGGLNEVVYFFELQRNVNIGGGTTIRIADIGASPRASASPPHPIILSNQKVLKGKIMPSFIMSQLSLGGEQGIYF